MGAHGGNKNAPLRTRFHSGGKGGIRTLGGPEPTTVFETVPFNHSGTFPVIQWCGRDYILKFRARMQFGVIHFVHILSFQFFRKRRCRLFFAMYKKHLLHGIFYV